jgi:pimeloyl-ACP methyl ester carboxylesterase
VELPPVQTLDLDGPIAYRRWGGDPESTFLLLHGLGASSLTWVQVGPSLAGLGTVIAPDLPGFGESPVAGRGVGLMDLRRTVSRLIEKVGSGRVIVAGSSMGGAISLLQAAVEPGSVAGVVLTNSVYPWRWRGFPHPLVVGAFATYATPWLGERFVDWRLRRLEPEQVVRMSLRVLAADPATIPEDVVQELIELTRARRDQPETARAFLDAARSMLRLGWHPAVARRAIDNVTCPVLVLHGRRDRLVPVSFAEAELALHPRWRGRFFPDLGHVAQMEAPGRWLAEVADWYSSTFD